VFQDVPLSFMKLLISRDAFVWLCSVLVLVAWSAPVQAQQQYQLTEDDQWTAIATPEPGSPQWQLAEARRALAEEDYKRAINLSSRWIDEHVRHPLMPEAYLIRADAKYANDDLFKALFDYEYIARMYPGSEVFVTALERELEIAKRFARGERRKLWGLKIVNAADEAEELLIRIQERLPGSRLGEEAGMELGDFYFRRRNMPMAAEAYDLFIENYPDSEQVSKARRRLIYSHLASFKGPQYDAAGLEEAKLRLQELRIVEPQTAQQVGADALLIRIDESNAAKLLENARWYLRTGDVISAELTIRRLVDQYPGTVAAAEALRVVERIVPQLPARVQQQAPDYEAMRQATSATP
jgi:outer membrane assembly lipoprotein YfiO